MSLRDSLVTNKAAAAVVAILILCLAGGVAYLSLRRPEQVQTGVWFYELSSKQLFPYRGDNVSSVKGPTGGEAVKAYVFTCGDCDKEADRSIAYLERPAVAASAGGLPPIVGGRDGIQVPQGGAGGGPVVMVASPERPDDWHEVRSEAGRQLLESASTRQCPDGQPVRACFPK